MKICNIGWANSIHVERIMSWFSRKGHDVSIITNTLKTIDGITVYDISRKPDLRPRIKRYKDFYFNVNSKLLNSLNEIIHIRKLVKEIKPHIVHSHSLWYPGYLGVYLNFHPFIVTVLNGDVLWKKNDISIYAKLRTRRALKKADIVTGESQILIDACIKNGVEEGKTHVTRGWGVDLKKFNISGSKVDIRFDLGLPVDCKMVLSPRNTGWFYNLENIVKAMPRVISKISNVYFVFIWHSNDTVKENELLKLASQLGVQDKIIIIGFVNHGKVVLYHKASDVMVSVSDRDSGPMALQEAMACGDVPVISDLSSVREWVENGWNGLLVDPNDVDQIADSIIKLLENDEMRKSFSERNWKLIQEKGDQDYWMEKMEDLYYQLISNRNKR